MCNVIGFNPVYRAHTHTHLISTFGSRGNISFLKLTTSQAFQNKQKFTTSQAFQIGTKDNIFGSEL